MKQSDWNGYINEIVFCLSLHLESIDEGDRYIRQFIHMLLKNNDGIWVPGIYKEDSRQILADSFNVSFDNEQLKFEQNYEGIHTRFLGSVIISDPTLLISASNCQRYVISVRRIHDGYSFMFFMFSKPPKSPIIQVIQHFDSLEKEAGFILNSFEKLTPDLFTSRQIGPATKYSIFKNITANVNIEVEIENPESEWSHFLSRHFCAEGINHTRLPRSVFDNNSIVIRHPSYHYSAELGEWYLLFPTDCDLSESQIVRFVDILASIEYYYTRFFYLIRGASQIGVNINKRTNEILSILHNAQIKDSSPASIRALLGETTLQTRELLQEYPKADRLLEEASHMYYDCGYLLDAIIQQSAYTQILETRSSPSIEGVAESIKLELQMRMYHIREGVYRVISRSFSAVNSLSDLVKAHFDANSQDVMLRQTKQIKYLTILLTILTIISLYLVIRQLKLL